MSTALVYAVIAAAGNVVGGWAGVRGAQFGLRVVAGFVAFSAGFMVSVALVRMLPEAIVLGGEGAAIWMLVGYLLVHLTQHTVTEHFHFGEETHVVSRAAGLSALIGLLLHTFFDGVAIASGFHVSTELGMLVFLAIFLHKLPEGLTISSLQVAGGLTNRVALLSAAGLGAATVLGVLLTEWVGFLTANGLAISAGVTLYVGASNLVPEFQAKAGWRLPLAFFAGAGVFLVLDRLLGHAV